MFSRSMGVLGCLIKPYRGAHKGRPLDSEAGWQKLKQSKNIGYGARLTIYSLHGARPI